MDFGSEAERVLPDEIIRHPKYFESGTYSISNDICLIYFASPILYDDLVQPICLPVSQSPEPTGKTCYIAGWGLKEESRFSSIATVLQDAPVPIINNHICASKPVYGKDFNPSEHICAGYLEGKIDACQGDSGGPLVCVENGKPVMRGIVCGVETKKMLISKIC